MSTAPTTIDRSELLKATITSATQELRQLQAASALETRDKLRKADLAAAQQSVKDTEAKVASFDKQIADQFEVLKTAVATRHREWRGRYHVPESSALVNQASAQLTNLIHGKCEWELTLQQTRQRYDEALRMEQKFTPVEAA